MLNLTLLTLVGCYIITLIKPFTVSSGLAVDWKMVIILLWRSRVEHVCRVVYLWCTNCYCSWHLWRALLYKRCAYSVHTIGGKPAYMESGARSHMAVSIM